MNDMYPQIIKVYGKVEPARHISAQGFRDYAANTLQNMRTEKEKNIYQNVLVLFGAKKCIIVNYVHTLHKR